MSNNQKLDFEHKHKPKSGLFVELTTHRLEAVHRAVNQALSSVAIENSRIPYKLDIERMAANLALQKKPGDFRAEQQANETILSPAVAGNISRVPDLQTHPQETAPNTTQNITRNITQKTTQKTTMELAEAASLQASSRASYFHEHGREIPGSVGSVMQFPMPAQSSAARETILDDTYTPPHTEYIQDLMSTPDIVQNTTQNTTVETDSNSGPEELYNAAA